VAAGTSAPKMSQGLPRDNNFDFLRLLAALTIVVHHVVFYVDVQFLWVTRENNWWFSGGVPLFFILSGMLIYASAEKASDTGRRWREFYFNRFLRIAPALYICLAGTLLILAAAGSLTAASPREVLALVGSYLFFVPVYNPDFVGAFGGGIVNSSLWTIPVEVSFYVVVPLLVKMRAKTNWRWMIAVVLVVGISSLLLYAAVGGNAAASRLWLLFGLSFAPYLFYFALGMIIGHTWRSIPWRGDVALIAVVLYFAITINGLGISPQADLLVNAAAAIPLAYSATWLGLKGPPVLRRFTSRVGDLSFSSYLWHQVFINVVLLTGFARLLTGEALVAMVLAATVAVALLSWWFAEKPALRLKRYSLRS